MLPDIAPIYTATVEAAIITVAQGHGGVFRLGQHHEEVEARVGRDATKRWVSTVIDRMLVRGLAVRLEKGSYAVADGLGRISPVAVAANLVDDGYVSLWAAAAHHGVTTQDVELVPVVTTARKARISSPELGASFVFHRIGAERLFGWREEPVDGVYARVAELERLLIDLLWFEGLPGAPEPAQTLAIWRAAASRVNPYVLIEYAQRMHSQRLARRVGYLMDLSEIEGSEALAGWRTGARNPFPLFRERPTMVDPSSKWGISG